MKTKEQQFTKQVAFRVTPDEKSRLQRIADDHQIPLGTLMRIALSQFKDLK